MKTTVSTQPLVSVVIPVYNQFINLFIEAVESALAQTYQNLEIVISDNHCTNEIPTYLSKINDSRLRVVKPDHLLEMGHNWQFAADNAQGEWITFLCSDDWMSPNCIEDFITALNQHNSPNISLMRGLYEVVEAENPNKVRYISTNNGIGKLPVELCTSKESLKRWLSSRPFLSWTQCALFRKDAYLNIRDVLSGQISWGAFDMALILRAHEQGDVIHLNKPLTKFRLWGPSDGKKMNSSLIPAIMDISIFQKMLNDLASKSSILDHTTLHEWNQYYSNVLYINTLTAFLKNEISVETAKEAMHLISNTVSKNSRKSQRIFNFIINPKILFLSKPFLRLGYRSVLSIQRLLKRPLY